MVKETVAGDLSDGFYLAEMALNIFMLAAFVAASPKFRRCSARRYVRHQRDFGHLRGRGDHGRGSGQNELSEILGFVVASAMTNVVGGFMITDRCLNVQERIDKK
jgi:hypothetical protein